MKEIKRRNFLSKFLKGGGAALFGLIPGSFFNSRKARMPGGQDFKAILKSTNSSNVYGILQGARLSPEEKFAILGIREANPQDLERILNDASLKVVGGEGCGGDCRTESRERPGGGRRQCSSDLSTGGSAGLGCGDGCGSGTVGSGLVCGNNCTGSPGPGRKLVLDPNGKLGIRFKQFNMQQFKNIVGEAVKLAGK